MNILVVDDKKTVQDNLASILTTQGYNVDLAFNGLDALAKAQQASYQLFVIDHLMPLMNGVQLTKNLKNNADLSHIPIIFMTTQGTHTIKKLAEFPLFDKVIDKPIDEHNFLSASADLIEKTTQCQSLHVNV